MPTVSLAISSAGQGATTAALKVARKLSIAPAGQATNTRTFKVARSLSMTAHGVGAVTTSAAGGRMTVNMANAPTATIHVIDPLTITSPAGHLGPILPTPTFSFVQTSFDLPGTAWDAAIDITPYLPGTWTTDITGTYKTCTVPSNFVNAEAATDPNEPAFIDGDSDARRIWYKVNVSVPGEMLAYVSSGVVMLADAFAGDSLSSLTLLAHDTTAIGSSFNVDFISGSGVTYYIRVRPYSNTDAPSATLQFKVFHRISVMQAALTSGTTVPITPATVSLNILDGDPSATVDLVVDDTSQTMYVTLGYLGPTASSTDSIPASGIWPAPPPELVTLGVSAWDTASTWTTHHGSSESTPYIYPTWRGLSVLNAYQTFTSPSQVAPYVTWMNIASTPTGAQWYLIISNVTPTNAHFNAAIVPSGTKVWYSSAADTPVSGNLSAAADPATDIFGVAADYYYTGPGVWYGSFGEDEDGGFFYPAYGLPVGASITSARLVLTAATGGPDGTTGLNLRIYGDKEVDPALVTGVDWTDFLTRPLTTAFTTYAPATVVGVSSVTLNVTNVIQEIVRQSSYAANNLQLLVKNNGSSTNTDFGVGTATLEVDYTIGVLPRTWHEGLPYPEVVLSSVGATTNASVALGSLAAGSHSITVVETMGGSQRVVLPFTVTQGSFSPPSTPPSNLQPSFTPAGQWVFVSYQPTYHTYTFPNNPDQMTSPYPNKTYTSRVSTGSNGQALTFEGAPRPATWTVQGTALSESHVNALRDWFLLNNRFYVVDHLGRGWIVSLEGLDMAPDVKADPRTPWIQKYTLTFLVYEGPVVIA